MHILAKVTTKQFQHLGTSMKAMKSIIYFVYFSLVSCIRIFSFLFMYLLKKNCFLVMNSLMFTTQVNDMAHDRHHSLEKRKKRKKKHRDLMMIIMMIMMMIQYFQIATFILGEITEFDNTM